MNLYIEIELCIAQLGTQVRRLGTQVRGNILAVSISGAALPYSAVWYQCNNPCTVVKNNHNYLLVVKIFNTDNPHI